jgi:hypothetical protein
MKQSDDKLITVLLAAFVLGLGLISAADAAIGDAKAMKGIKGAVKDMKKVAKKKTTTPEPKKGDSDGGGWESDVPGTGMAGPVEGPNVERGQSQPETHEQQGDNPRSGSGGQQQEEDLEAFCDSTDNPCNSENGSTGGNKTHSKSDKSKAKKKGKAKADPYAGL